MRAAVRRKRAKRQSRRNQILHTPESTSMSEYVRRMRPVAPLPDRAPLCCSALRRRGLSVYLATVGISRKPTVKMNNDRWAGDGAPACHCLQRLCDAVGLRDAVEHNANAAVPERGHPILPVLRQHAPSGSKCMFRIQANRTGARVCFSASVSFPACTTAEGDARPTVILHTTRTGSVCVRNRYVKTGHNGICMRVTRAWVLRLTAGSQSSLSLVQAVDRAGLGGQPERSQGYLKGPSAAFPTRTTLSASQTA